MPASAWTGETRVARRAGASAASDGHADADDERDRDRARGELHAGTRDAHAGGVEQRAEQLGEPKPGEEPGGGRRGAEDERLADDGGHDLAARRAERAQQRELARPLRDGDREGVEDDERADEQRGAGEREEHRREEAADRVVDLVGLLLGSGCAGLDVEIRRW